MARTVNCSVLLNEGQNCRRFFPRAFAQPPWTPTGPVGPLRSAEAVRLSPPGSPLCVLSRTVNCSLLFAQGQKLRQGNSPFPRGGGGPRVSTASTKMHLWRLQTEPPRRPLLLADSQLLRGASMGVDGPAADSSGGFSLGLWSGGLPPGR